MQPLRSFIVLLALLASGVARAERYALIIGVTTYPSLSAERQLQGPVNDARMMRSVLERKGFRPEAVQTLADGIAGAELPTRDAILASLDGLALKAKRGDFVFLYFSGHGSQMPTDSSIPAAYRKPDGRQEIFLPRDAKSWDTALSRVTNSIVDYELTARVDAMRARGAFVWVVVDACQSATLVRGGADPADALVRGIATSELGIPQSAFDTARAASIDTPAAAGPIDPPPTPADTTRGGATTAASERGGFVAFYAAQTSQLAREEQMPPRQPGQVPHGVFSYTIASALASIDGISYRQLGAFVLSQYLASNHTIPTPLYTGTDLDAPILGASSGSTTPVTQWPIVRDTTGNLSIAAGQLNQLSEGSMLLVVPSPIAADSAAIGRLRVAQADVLGATLQPVAANGQPALDPAKLPPGTYARMGAPTVDLTLRVLAAAPAAGNDAKAANAAIDSLRKQSPSGIVIQWVEPTETFDIALRAQDSRLWLVPASGQLVRNGADQTPSIRLNRPDLNGELASSLRSAGKALNLVRMAAALQASTAAHGLRVTMKVTRSGQVLPLSADSVSTLQLDDLVEVTLENTNRDLAMDVTALYVDADYGIQSLFPQRGESNRLVGTANSSGGTRQSFSFTVSDGTVGLERLVLIAVEERAGSDRYDFSYLAQSRIDRTRSAMDDIVSAFDAAGFGAPQGDATRGKEAKVPGRTQMAVYSFRVQSPRVASASN